MATVFVMIALTIGIPALLVWVKPNGANIFESIYSNNSYRDSLLILVPLSVLSGTAMLLVGAISPKFSNIQAVLYAIGFLSFFPISFTYFHLLGMLEEKLGSWASWLVHGFLIVGLSALFYGITDVTPAIKFVFSIYAFIFAASVAKHFKSILCFNHSKKDTAE